MCLRCADARPPRVAPTLTVPLPICMHVLRSWVPPVVGDRSPHGTPGTPKLEGSPGPNGTPTAPRTLDAHTAKAASGGRAVPASGGGTPELPTRLRARTQRSAAPPKLPTQVDDAFPLVSGDDGGVFVQGEGTKSGQRQGRAAAAKETADAFPLVSGDDGAVFVQGGAAKSGQRQSRAANKLMREVERIVQDLTGGPDIDVVWNIVKQSSAKRASRLEIRLRRKNTNITDDLMIEGKISVPQILDRLNN